MNTNRNALYSALFLSITLGLTGCGGSSDSNTTTEAPVTSDDAGSGTPTSGSNVPKVFTVAVGTDINTKSNALLSLNPGGPGGSPNQSLRGGDIIIGSYGQDNILIGGLGVDVLVGEAGDDILIGGTEDFNSSVDGDGKGADNRDRAFGNDGNDTFIWAPGDGSDFFDGGSGTDVLVLGVLGEQRNSDGTTAGAPFFNVSPPTKPDSQDFDGIFLDANNTPVVNVSTSPGFCTLVDSALNADVLGLIGVDHIVRFSLRSIANDFDAGIKTDDDGLRVAVSVRNVEYVVCAPRQLVDGGSLDNIEVLDLTSTPPTIALMSELPDYVVQMIR
jgi:hypothetical protein